MLSIADGEALSRALSSSLDHRLKHLLTTRRDQLGGDIAGQAHLVIVRPGDTPADLEQALGFSAFQNPIDDSRFGEPDFTPAWEWLIDHGFAFEAAFIFDDNGFAHVVIVPKQEGIEPALIDLCTTYASEHA